MTFDDFPWPYWVQPVHTYHGSLELSHFGAWGKSASQNCAHYRCKLASRIDPGVSLASFIVHTNRIFKKIIQLFYFSLMLKKNAMFSPVFIFSPDLNDITPRRQLGQDTLSAGSETHPTPLDWFHWFSWFLEIHIWRLNFERRLLRAPLTDFQIQTRKQYQKTN